MLCSKQKPTAVQPEVVPDIETRIPTRSMNTAVQHVQSQLRGSNPPQPVDVLQGHPLATHPCSSYRLCNALSFVQDAAASDDVAFYIMQAFTRNFRAFHEGRMSEADTKSQVTNLLIDEEPTMIDEFMQLFESCCHTRSWAGLAPLYHQSSVAEAHLADLEGGMAPPPLAPSHSGITNISSAPKHEVGTVAGAQRKSKSRRNSKKKGPEGKLEWQAIAKRLVPEGRASYAIWFTVANIGLILAIFAYMAGDYAVWVKEHRQEFSTDSSILSNSDEDAEVRSSIYTSLLWLATCSDIEHALKSPETHYEEHSV